MEPEMPGLVRCGQCGKEVNAKCVFCPFCGGRVGEEKISGDQVCPRCRTPLELRRRDDGIEIDYCPSCNGLWLDKGEFAILTAESTVYREETLREQYSRPMLPDTIRYIPCVRCGKLMVKKNFARISGVIIDECGRHGIWLDSGELEKIRHFILDGGLERLQFKEIEENRQGLTELAEKVDNTAFVQKLIHFWNWKRWFYS